VVDILETVEAFGQKLLEASPELYKEYEDLLEHMADATAFGEALNTLFQENKLISSGRNTDFPTIEGIIDSLFLELFSAVFFLSSLGEDDQIEDAILSVAEGLSADSSVPKQVVAGYEALSERVAATKVARKELMAQLADTAE
jgi:hypothetical protein